MPKFALFDEVVLAAELFVLLVLAQVLLPLKLTELNDDELAAELVFEVDVEVENVGDGARPYFEKNSFKNLNGFYFDFFLEIEFYHRLTVL